MSLSKCTGQLTSTLIIFTFCCSISVGQEEKGQDVGSTQAEVAKEEVLSGEALPGQMVSSQGDENHLNELAEQMLKTQCHPQSNSILQC